MGKENKEALQVTKEIIVKFIETQRISPSNFGNISPPSTRLFSIRWKTTRHRMTPVNAENSQELLEEKTGTATDAHAAKVSGLFARIVKWYDPLNRLLSLGLDQGWRKCLADAVLPGQAEGKRVLDLAAGTLDVTLAVRKRHPAAQVLAMDFCPPMLVHGQKKLSGEDKDFVLSVGADARALPLPDACMDGLTMAFGIRNIAPRSASFAEMARVLKPRGRACILEFGTGKTRIWLGIYNFYLKRILPVVGRLSGDPGAYAYLARSIIEFPSADALSDEMRAAGFKRIYHIPLCSGIVCLHVAEKG